MKKLSMFFLTAGMFAFVSCDSGTGTTDESERVISQDTVVTEMEAQRTIIDVDTIRETETIDVEPNNTQR